MPRQTPPKRQRHTEIMDDSLRLLARMIVRRHFDSQVPGTHGSSNGSVVPHDAPVDERNHLIMAEDDLLNGRAHR